MKFSLSSGFPRSLVLLSILVITVLLAFLLYKTFTWDTSFQAWIVATEGPHWRHSVWQHLAQGLSFYGDWIPILIVGSLSWGIAWLKHNHYWQRLLFCALIATVLAGMLANCLRWTTGRTRPRESPAIAAGWYGPYAHHHWIIQDERYHSFPSGHTTTAVAFATVLLLSRPLLGMVVFALALLIAGSRLVLGAHHLSDVTAATLLGFGVAYGVWKKGMKGQLPKLQQDDL